MIGRLMVLSVALLMTAHATDGMAADYSANLGYNSDYIFRGIPQTGSSAFGGLDLESGGFYAGAWAADVDDGLEIDYYGGYGFEAGAFSFTVGATWYTYTSGFDDEYLELNLGASWKFLSLDIADGKYDNFGGPRLDYRFYSLTASHRGFFARFGTFEQDFDGSYYEAGYEGSLNIREIDWFDYAFTVIHSDSTLLGGHSDTNYVFTLSRSFDF